MTALLNEWNIWQLKYISGTCYTFHEGWLTCGSYLSICGLVSWLKSFIWGTENHFTVPIFSPVDLYALHIAINAVFHIYHKPLHKFFEIRCGEYCLKLLDTYDLKPCLSEVQRSLHSATSGRFSVSSKRFYQTLAASSCYLLHTTCTPRASWLIPRYFRRTSRLQGPRPCEVVRWWGVQRHSE
jgi:hypothetical protein